MPELAKAYVQIIPSAEGIKGKLTETLGGEAEGAGESAGKDFSGGFGKTVGAIAKVGAAAIGAAATAVGALGKQAVEGFAKFEQLQGGLETMFEDLSWDVEENASRAFQTAGLSANDYMETVMGFSAALTSSLVANEGNIARAADLSDQIIIDMADNANKMGSSMESIQNAYSGFAKQNYTMLDNLKLGYGGTKEEMERLLSDAGKLAGVEFDISNFADVAEAIHVIQTEMGITGTTAEEAGATISGSLGMLSASWQNLVTGIANPDADIGALIGNVVESAETALGNLLPVVVQAMGGLADAVAQVAPIIAEKLPGLVQQVLPPLLSAAGSLLNGLISALPGLLSVLGSTIPMVIETINSGLFSALPELIPAAFSVVTTLASSIADALPELIPVAVDAILSLVDTLTNPDSIGALVDAALELILSLSNGLIQAIPQLVRQAPVIIKNVVTALTAETPQILSAALQLIVSLGLGLIEAIPELVLEVPKIIAAIVGGLIDGVKDIIAVGGQLVSGLWEGIKNSWNSLVENVKGLFGGFIGSIKDLLGIASPSKVFASIGANMAAGLGVGFDREMDAVARDINGSLTDLAGADLAIAGSYSFTGAGGQLAGAGGAGSADVISAVFAIGNMIVDAINSKSSDISLDGVKLARQLQPYSREETRRVGSAMVIGGMA